ncbi:hypothetical protein CORC01_06417 [Colletotrichum orchidophilum]|uniref:Uncharacterized protein n=1 Tax=Colletotrichum orchidophilum TaxID=1209926 RepID=A0A1G4B9Y5_9PEZI|nr:uncharacterized protein CORC01_06417 [Colletotrichum orchidophilum]OHE98220.1 hypothetical protein CORC01_06417 [Colletotrichum orchidophilum]
MLAFQNVHTRLSMPLIMLPISVSITIKRQPTGLKPETTYTKVAQRQSEEQLKQQPKTRLSFDLKCHYYATRDDISQCLISLWKYLLLAKHQKKLAGWELFAKRLAPGQDTEDKTPKIVILEMRFTHKWLTYNHMGVARRTFLDTMEVLRDIMSGLAMANPNERGALDWGKVFSFGCHPRIAGDCSTPWGIEPAGYYCHPREQGGPNGSAQKQTQELLLKYMEVTDPIRGMTLATTTSSVALREARRRVDRSDDNTQPLWNAIVYSSVLGPDPLQLDIDLAVFTTKKVVKWYDELLSLCKVAVQSQGIESRVDKAVTLANQLHAGPERRDAATDGISVTSKSRSEKTLCGEKDWGLGKVTVVEIEDINESAMDADRHELAQPSNARWWRRVLACFVVKVRGSNRQRQQDAVSKLVRRSLELSRTRAELSKRVVEFSAEVDQLQLLARGFILLLKLQTKWRQVQALAQRPGVTMVEVNKVTTVNIDHLSCERRRTQAIREKVSKLNRADDAMMQGAKEILERSKKMNAELKSLHKDLKKHAYRYESKARLEQRGTLVRCE